MKSICKRLAQGSSALGVFQQFEDDIRATGLLEDLVDAERAHLRKDCYVKGHLADNTA